MTSAEQNRATYERFCHEVLVNGNLDAIDHLVDPSVVSHSPFPGQAPGRDGFKQAFAMFRAAFPRLRVEIHELVAEGDKVAGYFTVTGVHTGDFMGIAPTGKTVTYDEMAIVRIANGKIAEHWSVADTLSMMQALGMVTMSGGDAPSRDERDEPSLLQGHGLS
jgi:predicted ester cyclase